MAKRLDGQTNKMASYLLLDLIQDFDCLVAVQGLVAGKYDSVDFRDRILRNHVPDSQADFGMLHSEKLA